MHGSSACIHRRSIPNSVSTTRCYARVTVGSNRVKWVASFSGALIVIAGCQRTPGRRVSAPAPSAPAAEPAAREAEASAVELEVEAHIARGADPAALAAATSFVDSRLRRFGADHPATA